MSAPGTRRLDAALAGLDAMIAVDSWLNETTRHAHVILPGLSPLERLHADDLYWIYAISSCAKWSDPVFAPDPDRPPEWEILLRLAGAMVGMPMPDVDVAAMDDLYVAGLVATTCARRTPRSPRVTRRRPPLPSWEVAQNVWWTWGLGSARGVTISGGARAG